MIVLLRAISVIEILLGGILLYLSLRSPSNIGHDLSRAWPIGSASLVIGIALFALRKSAALVTCACGIYLGVVSVNAFVTGHMPIFVFFPMALLMLAPSFATFSFWRHFKGW